MAHTIPSCHSRSLLSYLQWTTVSRTWSIKTDSGIVISGVALWPLVTGLFYLILVNPICWVILSSIVIIPFGEEEGDCLCVCCLDNVYAVIVSVFLRTDLPLGIFGRLWSIYGCSILWLSVLVLILLCKKRVVTCREVFAFIWYN